MGVGVGGCSTVRFLHGRKHRRRTRSAAPWPGASPCRPTSPALTSPTSTPPLENHLVSNPVGRPDSPTAAPAATTQEASDPRTTE
ncbi:hypothetical protein RVR_10542 [Actinacidiphila reveromycinica]|uniref:Uncharacterized protein n=1 Tax=Actinacidiphila reveromycinica TaxID=659352 RepID=A0A7U3VS21_9ACTN|nr:hypothetical protein RVR_10542 [Streptomyces sp. SN-593]